MEDRFYFGWGSNKEKWELFGWDLPEEPTTESTGYDDLDGPYETEELAEENRPHN